METLSKYFSYQEAFASTRATKEGIDNHTSDVAILSAIKNAAWNMDKVRELLANPIHVNSWYRCPKLNSLISKAVSSQHLRGEAIDFVCPGFGTPYEVAMEILNHKGEIRYDQLIYERTWVHISFSSDTSRPNRLVALTLQSNGQYFQGIRNAN